MMPFIPPERRQRCRSVRRIEPSPPAERLRGLRASVVRQRSVEGDLFSGRRTLQRPDLRGRSQQIEIAQWPTPAIASGQPEITVGQIFTAQGPRRTLHAGLMPGYPGELLLRVVAEVRSRCPDDGPRTGCAAVVRGLPVGRHRIRMVHMDADGRALAETGPEHPTVVTVESAQRRTGP